MLKLISEDEDLREITVGTYRYPTKLVSWGIANMPRIQELADGLRTEIITKYAGFERIIIACHSMGGVISRYFLINELKNKREIDRFYLALFAVPTLGAKIASLGAKFSFQHFHLSQLNTKSDLIRMLNEDWRSLGLSTRVPTVCVVGTGDKVVTIDSARALSEEKDIRTVHYNHGNITKPESSEDERYIILKQFLVFVARHQDGQDYVVTPRDNLGISSRLADPLFSVYRPEHKRYYVERDVDRGLAGEQRRHFWIHGASGVGKTSALRYYAFEEGLVVQVGLSGHAGRHPDELLGHIADALADRAGISRSAGDEGVPDSLALAVRAAEALRSVTRVVLAIEEIPRQDSQSWEQFLGHLLALCLAFDTLSDEAPLVIIALTSIDDPLNGVSVPPKFRERVRVIAMTQWNSEEAGRLTDLLAGEIRPELTEADRHEISVGSRGLPRTIKQLFLLLQDGTAGGRSLGDMLVEIRLEQSR